LTEPRSIHNNAVVDSLSTTFAALSDATRREILARLQAGPASVHELAQPFAISQQAISKHLAYLERARLIEKRRDGREHICTLNPAPIRELATWAEQYRQYWDGAFGRLDDLLHELHPPKKRRSKK
jgi:DNA-binding transcriptional ArsR family regulator